jgi:hypothetical protein
MNRKTTGWMLALMLGLFAVQRAQAFYNPSVGKWLSRDPVAEKGFAFLSATSKDELNSEFNPYGFLNNTALDHFDYLGLTGTSSSGTSCAISGSNMGRLSFRGFSPAQLAEFRLIDEDDPNKTSIPDGSGSSSGKVDGFWWKGARTQWYKVPDFCWAIVEPAFSVDGFSVKWCCDDCPRLLCGLLTKRPCTPGFVPNSGDTENGKYPFEN